MSGQGVAVGKISGSYLAVKPLVALDLEMFGHLFSPSWNVLGGTRREGEKFLFPQYRPQRYRCRCAYEILLMFIAMTQNGLSAEVSAAALFANREIPT